MDELEDSPPPDQDTPSASVTGSPSGKSRLKAVHSSVKRATSSVGSSSASGAKKEASSSGVVVVAPMGLARPVDQLTIEEIEALPAAKRRKSLKARGASGPGRGWRKGLKMDQKPVYVQPGGGEGPPIKVASGTPLSFSNINRPKSSLARDALSKTSTPLRSESPYSRSSPLAIDEMILEGEPKVKSTNNTTNGEEEKKQTISSITAPITTSGPSRVYHRSVQPVLPLAKIPIGFLTVTPLDKSGSKRPVRLWQKRAREVISLTGKSWTASSWITLQQSLQSMEKEKAAMIASAITAATASPMDVDTPPSTPGDSHIQLPRTSMTNDIRPSPLSNSSTFIAPAKLNSSLPELDWKGNSAAFSAAIKRNQ